MPILDELTGAFKRVKSRLGEWYDKLSGTPHGEGIPSEAEPDRVASFLRQAYADAKQYRSDHFQETGSYRFNEVDPINWWARCQQLEAGNHWQVFGHRNEDGEDWKQEPVDNIIGDQVRVRTEYLSANFHDITISPNIDNISEILDQERKEIGWSDKIRFGIKVAKMTGDHWWNTYLDKSENPLGVGQIKNCVKGSILLNPYASSKKKSDGCWMLQDVQMVSGQYIQDMINAGIFKDVVLADLGSSDNTVSKNIFTSDRHTKTYQLTKLYDQITTYLDDETEIPSPVDEGEIQGKIQRVMNGEPVEVQETDNHLAHAKAYDAHVNQLESVVGNSSDMNEVAHAAIAQGAFVNLIAQHGDMVKKTGKVSTMKKYPNGRLVIMISGSVVYDEPSPYNFDWRNLYHQYFNERVVGRLDGRGDVEILMTDQKIADKALARAEDAMIKAGQGKEWFHIDDKQYIEDKSAGGYNNDPRKPAYFSKQPPFTHPVDTTLPQNLRLYEEIKANTKGRLGVNDITIGEDNNTGDSGYKTELLQRQNQTIVTGEPNSNLSSVVEDIVESLLMIYKQFYGVRTYIINGQPTVVNVTKILSVQEVTDQKTGEKTEQPIDKFEVSIRPNSNFPYKWENDFTLLLKGFEIKDLDGTSAVPFGAVRDMFIQRFPFLRQYETEQQATLVGMKVLQQQQMAQEQKKKDLEGIANAFKAKERSQIVKSAVNPEGQLIDQEAAQVEQHPQSPYGE